MNKRLILSSSFRCDQIYKYEIYDFGYTLLCYVSWTWMFNKPASEHEAQQSVTRIVSMTLQHSVIPKAATKQDLLFNKPGSVMFWSKVWRSIWRVEQHKVYFLCKPKIDIQGSSIAFLLGALQWLISGWFNIRVWVLLSRLGRTRKYLAEKTSFGHTL